MHIDVATPRIAQPRLAVLGAENGGVTEHDLGMAEHAWAAVDEGARLRELLDLSQLHIDFNEVLELFMLCLEPL